MQRKTFWLVVALFALFLVFCPAIYTGFNVGYIHGAQGLQAEFNSVHYKEYWYDRTHRGPNPAYDSNVASAYDFFDRVNFDPDDSTTKHPNLHASMAPITRDEEVEPKRYAWSLKVGETVEDGMGYDIYEEYEMLRYRCTWSMNLWLDGPEGESWGTSKYLDAELWIRLKPQEFLYFEDNPDEVYFAPAYFGLSQNVIWGYMENGEPKEDPNMGDRCDIFPEAQGETMGIFYERGGAEVEMKGALLAFRGRKLDPAIFRNEYWIRVGVDNFYTHSFYEYLFFHKWQQPSAQLNFLVYVYVVGKWTVMLETGEVPSLEPHQTNYSPGGIDFGAFFRGLVRWFQNPFNTIAFLIFLGVIGAIILLILYPMLLTTRIGKLIVALVAIGIVIGVIYTLIGGIA